jgi:hypothetical protein
MIMEYEAPDGKKTKHSLPGNMAWVMARAVAQHRYGQVVLFGKYGSALFHRDGSGVVTWNEKSTCPSKVEEFADNCTVCI